MPGEEHTAHTPHNGQRIAVRDGHVLYCHECSYSAKDPFIEPCPECDSPKTSAQPLVYLSPRTEVYHQPGMCIEPRSDNVPKAEAEEMGFSACRRCYHEV